MKITPLNIGNSATYAEIDEKVNHLYEKGTRQKMERLNRVLINNDYDDLVDAQEEVDRKLSENPYPNELTLSVTTSGTSIKPPKDYYPSLQFRQLSVNPKDIYGFISTMKGLVQNGHGFTHNLIPLMNGAPNVGIYEKTQRNFAGTRLVWLDYDNQNVTLEEAWFELQDLVDSKYIGKDYYDYMPIFGYETFSSNKNGKGNCFRLVFLTDSVIKTQDHYKEAIEQITKYVDPIIGCVHDKACDKVDQFYWGTTKSARVIFYSPKVIRSYTNNHFMVKLDPPKSAFEKRPSFDHEKFIESRRYEDSPNSSFIRKFKRKNENNINKYDVDKPLDQWMQAVLEMMYTSTYIPETGLSPNYITEPYHVKAFVKEAMEYMERTWSHEAMFQISSLGDFIDFSDKPYITRDTLFFEKKYKFTRLNNKIEYLKLTDGEKRRKTLLQWTKLNRIMFMVTNNEENQRLLFYNFLRDVYARIDTTASDTKDYINLQQLASLFYEALVVKIEKTELEETWQKAIDYTFKDNYFVTSHTFCKRHQLTHKKAQITKIGRKLYAFLKEIPEEYAIEIKESDYDKLEQRVARTLNFREVAHHVAQYDIGRYRYTLQNNISPAEVLPYAVRPEPYDEYFSTYEDWKTPKFASCHFRDMDDMATFMTHVFDKVCSGENYKWVSKKGLAYYNIPVPKILKDFEGYTMECLSNGGDQEQVKETLDKALRTKSIYPKWISEFKKHFEIPDSKLLTNKDDSVQSNAREMLDDSLKSLKKEYKKFFYTGRTWMKSESRQRIHGARRLIDPNDPNLEHISDEKKSKLDWVKVFAPYIPNMSYGKDLHTQENMLRSDYNPNIYMVSSEYEDILRARRKLNEIFGTTKKITTKDEPVDVLSQEVKDIKASILILGKKYHEKENHVYELIALLKEYIETRSDETANKILELRETVFRYFMKNPFKFNHLRSTTYNRQIKLLMDQGMVEYRMKNIHNSEVCLRDLENLIRSYLKEKYVPMKTTPDDEYIRKELLVSLGSVYNKYSDSAKKADINDLKELLEQVKNLHRPLVVKVDNILEDFNPKRPHSEFHNSKDTEFYEDIRSWKTILQIVDSHFLKEIEQSIETCESEFVNAVESDYHKLHYHTLLELRKNIYNPLTSITDFFVQAKGEFILKKARAMYTINTKLTDDLFHTKKFDISTEATMSYIYNSSTRKMYKPEYNDRDALFKSHVMRARSGQLNLIRDMVKVGLLEEETVPSRDVIYKYDPFDKERMYTYSRKVSEYIVPTRIGELIQKLHLNGIDSLEIEEISIIKTIENLMGLDVEKKAKTHPNELTNFLSIVFGEVSRFISKRAIDKGIYDMLAPRYQQNQMGQYIVKHPMGIDLRSIISCCTLDIRKGKLSIDLVTNRIAKRLRSQDIVISRNYFYRDSFDKLKKSKKDLIRLYGSLFGGLHEKCLDEYFNKAFFFTQPMSLGSHYNAYEDVKLMFNRTYREELETIFDRKYMRKLFRNIHRQLPVIFSEMVSTKLSLFITHDLYRSKGKFPLEKTLENYPKNFTVILKAKEAVYLTNNLPYDNNPSYDQTTAVHHILNPEMLKLDIVSGFSVKDPSETSNDLYKKLGYAYKETTSDHFFDHSTKMFDRSVEEFVMRNSLSTDLVLETVSKEFLEFFIEDLFSQSEDDSFKTETSDFSKSSPTERESNSSQSNSLHMVLRRKRIRNFTMMEEFRISEIGFIVKKMFGDPDFGTPKYKE